ncbi:metabotropic glutamate receptor 8 [Eurytemora carolleeae]|uniref:metabotropic glutamate receptor 8 n=1 Tax=Eurytemora carolleeae TaxID=1294199 RepID=UPI000C766C97|nr:metabotropic glutamate receptor 8 [Eurytemora carolleeae]|eukprot:XP_023327303.1 metabotropic glutamate receptor 8-like [Eurytemora affinis]
MILDTCSNPSYALEQSMEFVRAFMSSTKKSEEKVSKECSEFEGRPTQPVAGVIGGALSGVSIMVANILKLFRIPQISYASTSLELSDKSRFEYFSRVVPPDNFQAQAMVEIVKQLGWTYVSTVAAQGEYGEKGIASFIQIATKSGICIATSAKISRHAGIQEFDGIVDALLEDYRAKAVVLFVDEDKTRKLLSATTRKGVAGKFYWIGSDSWGAKIFPVRDQEWAAEGAITILPKRSEISGFDRYFKNLVPSQHAECTPQEEADKKVNCRNPYFREFWSKHHRCKFPGLKVGFETEGDCTGKEGLHKHLQEGLVPFVVDAVYAMANSLHNLVLDVCCNSTQLYSTREEETEACVSAGRFKICEAIQPVPEGKQLLNYIRKVSFTSIQGPDIGDVKFNEDGDAMGRYSVYQYQRQPKENSKGRWEYVWIGEFGERESYRWNNVNETGVYPEIEGYTAQELYFEVERARWNIMENISTGSIPASICSLPCGMGEIKNFETACCWSCVACREDSIVVSEDTCLKCPVGYVSNYFKDTCIKIEPDTISWLNPWAFFPLILSSVGILLTLEVFTAFILYNKTSVIMASGRELCYVLLSGILISYLIPFVILARPTPLSCTVLRGGLGFCLCICYSALLTKTNRISRIFSSCAKGNQKPKWISPRSQVLICLGFVSVQMVGVITWLMFYPPDTQVMYMYPLDEPPSALETCACSTFSILMSLVYNMVLIILCTIYAFKTRKIPENFNEAKYIGFTMYSTCIIWLAFVPIFFGTNNDYQVQISSLCMCVTVSATVALCLLFGPKMYVVLLHPEKCARTYPGAKKTATTKALKFSKSRDSSVTLLSDEEEAGE